MIPASAESKSEKETSDATHREKADTSPPNGMLLVNRLFGSVSQRERTLNQQFGNLELRYGDNAFTRVNVQSTL